MAKNFKKKKNPLTADPSRRLKEKMQNLMRSFDITMLGVLLVIVVCIFIGRCGEYELGQDNNYGFALWFLLIPAYPILEVLSFSGWLAGFDWHWSGWEAEMLGLCDMLLVCVFWLWIRWYGRRRGLAFVRMIRTFVLIILAWGIFQILCCAVSWLWDNGGFASFNRHLENKSGVKK